MRKVLVLIPVLVLLLAFTFGAVSTAYADQKEKTPRCWYEEYPGDDCLWECCALPGGIVCERTRICTS